MLIDPKLNETVYEESIFAMTIKATTDTHALCAKRDGSEEWFPLAKLMRKIDPEIILQNPANPTFHNPDMQRHFPDQPRR